MQDDLTSKIPFRDNLRNIKNLLSHVYAIDKTYYFLAALRLFTDAARTAFIMVLSADILELLYKAAPWEEIRETVILLLSVPFLLSIVSGILLQEFILPKRENIKRIYDADFAAKFQQMDYSLIDSPYVRKLSEHIAKANNWSGGLYNLFWDFDAIVSGICRLICSAAVAFPILKSIAVSRNLWMYPGLAALALILWRLAAATRKANASYQEKLLADYESRYPENMRRKYHSFSWYWLFRCTSGDYHYIKDIHLYDGYGLMKKYTSENLREGERLMPWASVVGALAGRFGFLRGAAESLMAMAGYLISASYALLGTFPISETIKFAGSVTAVLTSIQDIIFQLNNLSLTARKAVGILEMLSISDEMYKGKLPVEKRLDNKYEIEFRHVSFRYPGTEQYALKDFSIKLRIGERMAVVGMNGSGKTTMIKLLCRLYDPQEGDILLNGVDIRKFRQDEYIRLFSVVFQDFKLLSLPLGQNVAASLQADEETAVKALCKAGMSERLRQFPKGLDTCLYQDIADDGVEISGGEAQKIAIARALYKDAPFVLLDEPTASLDPLSEYEIYSGFDAMVGNKTAIYISHRLSSCRFCNDIAVFHEGRLIQRGNHEELLKDRNGKYYELWHAQAQYYT